MSQRHEALKRLSQAALKKAGSAASDLAKKLTKNVTSITKKIATQAPAKPEKPAVKPAVKSAAAKPAVKGAEPKPAAKPAVKKAEPQKAAAKTPAKGSAKTSAKAEKPAAPSAKPAAKGEPAKKTAKAPAKKTTAKAPAKTAPETKTVKPAPVKAPRPSRTLRPKTFGELETARPYGFPEQTPELPDAYGEDRLVLMTKDPETLFAYWEITPERRAEGERAKRSGQEYREALRLNWASEDLLADSFALVPVLLDAGRWYLRVPFSGLSYTIEIGWLSAQGHFISLLESSNPSDAPESWARTRERLRQSDAAVLEYAMSRSQPLGSSESRPVASPVKRPSADWNYEGPGARSSSDAVPRKDDATGRTRA